MIDIQYMAAEIRRGKKKIERKKPRGKNIMVCPISYGNHKMIFCCMLLSENTVQLKLKWGDGGGRHWLVRLEWRPAGWSV